eukprot:750811-Rhodomonas_salina.1
MRPEDGVSLHDAMHMPWWGADMLIQCLQSLAQGVAGMHDCHLVPSHGDICSYNVQVIYNDEPRCTILDLCRSVVRDEGMMVYGTRGWQAPEVVGGATLLARTRAEMLDVWALG